MSKILAISAFQIAHDNFQVHRFAQARASMSNYSSTVNYYQFDYTDKRSEETPGISIIIVGFQTNQVLLDCLQSVFKQQGCRFEVILVDNGGNHNVHSALAQLPMLWVRPPINLRPSEARNVGVFFAKSDLLVFLDDDAIMAPGYLQATLAAFKDSSIIAVRGRVLPKTAIASAHQPRQYDLGHYPCPAELNFEGNCVVRRPEYLKMGGFDPLLFGHEGKELSSRLRSAFPGKKILYWPELVVRHDYAQEEQRLNAKRERQRLSAKYIEFMEEILSQGVSFIIRVQDNLQFVHDFISSLLKFNTYKPLEVFLWAKNSKQALEISQTYLTRIFIRVLPRSLSSFGRITHQIRYPNIVLVDLPFKFESDVVSHWVLQQKTDSKAVMICNKQDFALLAKSSFTTPINQLADTIGRRLEVSPVETHLEQANKETMQCQNELEKKQVQTHKVQVKPSAGKLKISFIIPVYNKASTLKSTLSSVEKLNSVDYECIIVDDCSTDGSKDIIIDFHQRNNHVVPIFNASNMGAGASRNIGIRQAKGEYVFFLDADDRFNASVLLSMITCADKHSSDIIRGLVKGSREDGTPRNVVKDYLLHNKFKAKAQWQNDKYLWFYWYFYANLYRRSFLHSNHIQFPEGVRNEDPIFLCKNFLYAQNITLYPEIVYYYTITEQQQKRTGKDFLKGWAQGYFSVFQLIRQHPKQKIYFLFTMSALERHCTAIVQSFAKDEAINILNYIAAMYRTFEADMKNGLDYYEFMLQDLQPWQKKEIDKTIAFGKKFSGRDARRIYNLLT